MKSRNNSSRETQTEQSASGARYGLFATLKGGISELLETLANKVQEHAAVCLDTTARSLSRESDGTWKLTRNDGTARFFDAVVLAIPAYRVAELLAETDVELSRLLSAIEYASTAIVVSGHKLSDIEHPLNAFGLVIPAMERRRILAVSFTSRKFPDRSPAGCVQLRTFVGGAMQPELLNKSDEQIIELVKTELKELLGVTGEPDFVRIARWNRAMPQYHVGHLDRIEEIDRRVKLLPGLALAGNAYRGVGIPDCIHSGELAAESVMGDKEH